MKSPFASLLLLAMLLAAGVLLVLDGRRGDPDSTGENEPATPESSMSPGEPATPSGSGEELGGSAPRVALDPVPSDSLATEESGRTSRLVVHVTTSAGDPGVGLTLTLTYEDEFREHVVRSATDERGSAIFEVEPWVFLKHLRVLPGPASAPAGMILGKTARPGEAWKVAIRVETGWTLRGRVVDSEGHAVAGAEVQARCRRDTRGEPDRIVTADSNGEFRVPHLGSAFCVTASAPGWACSSGLVGELTESVSSEKLTVVLEPEAELSGHVVDRDGRPVEGVAISVDPLTEGIYDESDQTGVPGIVRFSAGRSSTDTDPAGAFTIQGLPSGMHRLHARKSPFLIESAWHTTGERDIEIVLDPGLSLSGKVFDSAGRPARGARVRFWPYHGNLQTVDRESICGEHGTFTLRGMSLDPSESEAVPGLQNPSVPPYAIAVLHEGHAVEVVQPVKPGRNGGEYVEVHLHEERSLSGTVVDKEGRPIPAAAVWIAGSRELETEEVGSRRRTWELVTGIADVRTDLDGGFQFLQLYPGTFTVYASMNPGLGPIASQETAAGHQDVLLVLDTGAKEQVQLTGSVVDRISGESIDGARIIARIVGTGDLVTTRTEAGRFTLPALPEGELEVFVRADGYVEQRELLQRVDAGVRQLDVRLSPQRSLELVVVTPSGARLAHGTIQVATQDGEVLMIDQPGLPRDSVRLRDGKAKLLGLPAEPLILELRGHTEHGQIELDELVDLTRPFTGVLEIVVGH